MLRSRLLLSVVGLVAVLGLSCQGLPIEEQEEPRGDMLYYMPAEKRSAGVNQLRELLHALEAEAALEEAEAVRAGDEMPLAVDDGAPLDAHSVDKRRRKSLLKRRRYGFWVTAINKMGNMKRSVPFIPALGGTFRDKKHVTGSLVSTMRSRG